LSEFYLTVAIEKTRLRTDARADQFVTDISWTDRLAEDFVIVIGSDAHQMRFAIRSFTKGIEGVNVSGPRSAVGGRRSIRVASQ